MMIRSRGFQFKMTLDDEAVRLHNLARHIEASRPKVLTAIGVQCVSWAVQDFRARSNGQQAAGVSWEPISLSGARTRLAARQPYKTDSANLLALHNEEAPLREKLRLKLPKGKTPGKAKSRGKLAADFMSTDEGKAIKAIQKKRGTIKARRAREIEREQKNAKVGVDTGRLVNSLVYGVAELEAAIKVPTGKGVPKPGQEPLTRAMFDVTSNSIRVGSHMKYAEYFDQRRPIFPPGFIDATRRQSIEKLIEKTIDLEIARFFNEGK